MNQAASGVLVRPFVRVWRALPATLAFAILAVQVWIPWSVRHLETVDGSSYVYSAVVARDLLLHPDSAYASLYEFQRSVVPNWGTMIFLNVILSFVGVENAEKLLMSLYLVIGFFCFSYCVRSIAPTESPWTPIANFVLQNWLLWAGFYNFYLGTMLGLLLIGFYIRHPSGIPVRRAGILSIGLVAVFFAHLMAAVLTGLALVVIASWTFLARPLVLRSALLPSGVRQVGLVVATLLPVMVLFAFFARSSTAPIRLDIGVAEAWTDFPMHLFTTAAGPIGNQTYLWPAVLAYIVVGIAVMQRSEWTSVRGGLAMAAMVSFLIYLFLPDSGFGGERAKIRFAWAIFVLGGLVAVSVLRLQRFRIPFALYVAGFLIANLAVTTHSLWAYSAAVEDYLSALDDFPRGARIIRLRYPTVDVPERYGYHDIWRDPLVRVDSLAAARCRCIDLSDYQAATRIFPIVYKPAVDRSQQGGWSLNFAGPNTHTSGLLAWLFENAPGPPDYVIVTEDRLSPQTAFDPLPDFPRVLATLNEFGQITAKSLPSQLVRVYKRTE